MSDQPQSPVPKAPLILQLLRRQPPQPASAASPQDGDRGRAEPRSDLVNQLLDRPASVSS